ncbi:hypothetical protein OIU76_011842, partial [Salix suchowensis]
MGNPFAKCNQKGDSFSGLWKLRAHKNIHLYWISDDLFGGETLMGGGNISCNKSQTVDGLDNSKTDNKKDVIVSDFKDHKKWKPLVSLSPTLIVWIPALQQFSLLYSK